MGPEVGTEPGADPVPEAEAGAEAEAEEEMGLQTAQEAGGILELELPQ